MNRNDLIARLKEEKADFGRRRERQLRLARKTGLRGHYRRAADLGHRMRHKQKRIEEFEAGPEWKLSYAAKFIAPWEGFRSATYYDSGGIPTIGFGHTGKHAYPGNTISYAFALLLLASDLREAARYVNKYVKVPLTWRERIACISFVFNVGPGGLLESTFLKRLNRNDRKGAAEALMWWVKDDRGNTLLGLKRRRQAEYNAFRYPKRGVKRW